MLTGSVLSIHFDLFLIINLAEPIICIPLQPANEEAGCSEGIRKAKFKRKVNKFCRRRKRLVPLQSQIKNRPTSGRNTGSDFRYLKLKVIV